MAALNVVEKRANTRCLKWDYAACQETTCKYQIWWGKLQIESIADGISFVMCRCSLHCVVQKITPLLICPGCVRLSLANSTVGAIVDGIANSIVDAIVDAIANSIVDSIVDAVCKFWNL